MMQRHTCVRKLLLAMVDRAPSQPFGDFRPPESDVRLNLVMGNPPAANVRIDGFRVDRQESRQILSCQEPVGEREIVEDIRLGAGRVFGLIFGRAHRNSSTGQDG